MASQVPDKGMSEGIVGPAPRVLDLVAGEKGGYAVGIMVLGGFLLHRRVEHPWCRKYVLE